MTNNVKTIARIGGFLYLMIILLGLFGEAFVRSKLIVSGNAAATAANIIAHQFLWRMGIAGDLLMHVCDVGLVLVIYILLKPVNRYLALLVMLFNLVQTSVLVANKLNMLMPLFLLGNADYLKSFEPLQLYTLTYLFMRLHENGFGFGLIYFGFEIIVVGYLIIRSAFIPKIIGIGMQIAGVCYLINTFSLILAPDFANMVNPFILIPSFLGELSLCLWLLIKGVDEEKWMLKANKASAAGSYF